MHWDDWMDQAKRLIPAIGNDDAHGREAENHDTYQAWTMVRVKERTVEAVMGALRAGASYVTTGPTIDDVTLEWIEDAGEATGHFRATVECSAALRVLAITNYIGQAGCPIGIDRTKGRVSWNNPIYSYKVNSATDMGTRGAITYKRLNTTLTYSFYGDDNQRQTDAEGNRVNLVKQSKNYDYVLALDKDGEIVGGKAYSDSGHFLWIGLFAVQASRDQKAPGNPNIDVRRVLALARASAMPEVQKKYDDAGIVMGPRVDPVFEQRRLEAIAKAKAEKRAREEALAKAEEERIAAEAAAVEAAAAAIRTETTAVGDAEATDDSEATSATSAEADEETDDSVVSND